MTAIRVERFEPGRLADFDALHSDGHGAGWCRCVAWWVPTWEGWGERSAAENAALRASLCAAGEYDGLIAYVGPEPVGWCQLGPRDRLPKLLGQLDLAPDAAVWAVTCFLVLPAWRRRGVAAALLDAAISAARDAGATRLEAYPRGAADEPAEMWTGPGVLFERAGFATLRHGTPRAVVALDLEAR